MNSRQTTYQMYLSHTTAQNNETNDCYKIWRSKHPKRSRSKKLLPKKDQKWWSGMSSNAKQKASSQFLSHVCCYQHWWREFEKTSTREKNLRKANLSADDISKSGTRRYALHKAENWRASKERKKERRKDKTRMQSWKLVPWRAPKNSSRFSQHWWRGWNPQSRNQGIEEKERAPERREGKENARAQSCRETNKSGVQNNKSNAANFFTLF